MTPPRFFAPAVFPALAAAALLLTGASGRAAADVVVLKTGGEVRGEFVGDPRADGPLVVRTRGGASVTVPRAAAARWAYRSPKKEEFEFRFDRTAHGPGGAPLDGAEAAEAWWDLAEWALARRLTDERDRALEEVVRHAPRHEPARKALGHMIDEFDGEWVSRGEWRERRGLVLYDGRAVTPEERDLLARADADDAARKQYYRDVRRWHRDLRRPRRAGAARAAIAGLTDPAAAEALRKYLAEDPEPAVRTLLVRTLAGMPGAGPVPGLAEQAMRDVAADVRAEAIAALKAPDRREAAGPLLRGGLRSEQNATVRRAASALAEVGDARAVPDLIRSLVTTHYYKVAVPDPGAMNVSAGANGVGFGGNNGNPGPAAAGRRRAADRSAAGRRADGPAAPRPRPDEAGDREGEPHQPRGAAGVENPRRPPRRRHRSRRTPGSPPTSTSRPRRAASTKPLGPPGGNSTAARTDERRGSCRRVRQGVSRRRTRRLRAFALPRRPAWANDPRVRRALTLDTPYGDYGDFRGHTRPRVFGTRGRRAATDRSAARSAVAVFFTVRRRGRVAAGGAGRVAAELAGLAEVVLERSVAEPRVIGRSRRRRRPVAAEPGRVAELVVPVEGVRGVAEVVGRGEPGRLRVGPAPGLYRSRPAGRTRRPAGRRRTRRPGGSGRA